jgi:hypothetical protein
MNNKEETKPVCMGSKLPLLTLTHYYNYYYTTTLGSNLFPPTLPPTNKKGGLVG